jgi:hypothetical protein
MFIYIIRLVLALLFYLFIICTLYCLFSIRILKKSIIKQENAKLKGGFNKKIRRRKRLLGFSIFGIMVLVILSIIIPK